MNIALNARTITRWWPILVAYVVLTAGCATNRIHWETRIGTYTFDEAVIELGPPDKQAVLQDGTKVADWLMARGSARSYPATGYGGYPPYGTIVIPTMVNSPDYFLRLTFGADGKLNAWKKYAK